MALYQIIDGEKILIHQMQGAECPDCEKKRLAREAEQAGLAEASTEAGSEDMQESE